MSFDKAYSRMRVRPAAWQRVVQRAVPGLALCFVGLSMLLPGRAQPAWIGQSVGPGLMAQLLAIGVIGLGGAWTIWCALTSDQTSRALGCRTSEEIPAERWSGPALLGAVFLFALTMPFVGLVVSGCLAAAVAAWGAGERKPAALAVTVSGLGVMIVVIGFTLLPPTTPLWPDL